MSEKNLTLSQRREEALIHVIEYLASLLHYPDDWVEKNVEYILNEAEIEFSGEGDSGVFCEWTFTPYQGAMVSCNNAFIPMGNSPEDMNMKFCCYCGKNIKNK